MGRSCNARAIDEEWLSIRTVCGGLESDAGWIVAEAVMMGLGTRFSARRGALTGYEKAATRWRNDCRWPIAMERDSAVASRLDGRHRRGCGSRVHIWDRARGVRGSGFWPAVVGGVAFSMHTPGRQSSGAAVAILAAVPTVSDRRPRLGDEINEHVGIRYRERRGRGRAFCIVFTSRVSLGLHGS